MNNGAVQGSTESVLRSIFMHMGINEHDDESQTQHIVRAELRRSEQLSITLERLLCSTELNIGARSIFSNAPDSARALILTLTPQVPSGNN